MLHRGVPPNTRHFVPICRVYRSALRFCCNFERETALNEIVTEVVNGESYRYYPLGKHVVRAVGVCGGRPTFKYTRIEIVGSLDRLAAGENLDDVVAGYRGRVTRDAIVEAIQVVI